MTKETVNALYETAKAEIKKNTERVDGYLQLLVPTGYVIRNNISLDCFGKHIQYYIECQFIGKDGKDVFGADFRLNYENRLCWHDDDEPGKAQLSIDCGSLGMTTFEEKPERWAQYEMMGNVVRHREELTALLDSLPTEAQKAYHEADAQYQKEQREIEKATSDAKEQAIKDALVIGATYSDQASNPYSDYTNNYTYTVTKITPKRVYVSFTHTRLDNLAVYDNNWDKVGHKVRTTASEGTGYIKYDMFVYRVQHAGEKYAATIYDGLEGMDEHTLSCATDETVIKD